MAAALAKLMILVYGLSIAGYVLLDSGHEVLHAIKSNLHHHVEEHHHDHTDAHHHVEDHQNILTPATDQSTESTNSAKTFGFLLFFQSPSPIVTIRDAGDLHGNCLLQKLLTLTRVPLTPPPLG